ncbi:amino acid adenylation domain-containing protein [Streptomyces lunaelactis]|uniref:amino acid adenylation domain-containing protein n=1 Tax=Streptomyces lunaelactis TaxID=1535768 RepID=UPI0015854EB1|nr:amino acid adenylation domain-containing protein [Streptomyces lunaelactis]NUK51224.1 amino acid adenylation domain-containing protein [Streptomyces lunaelactis]
MSNSHRLLSGDAASCRVLVNEEEQYSIWPAELQIPVGWHPVGWPGSRAQCLATVETLWTDMRPRSSRPRGAAGTWPSARRPKGPPAAPTVSELIRAHAARQPEAIAVISGAHKLTYGALDRRANQLAHQLLALGVRAETVVTVCMERSADMVVAMLAVLKTRGAFLPLDPAFPDRRLARLAEHAGSGVVLTTRKHAGAFEGGGSRVVLMEDFLADAASWSTEQPPRGPRSGDLAYMIYTSGSTGTPKGVMISHHSLSGVLPRVAAEYGLSPGDRVLQLAALGFDTSLEQVFATLLSGATLVLGGRRTWAPTELLHQLPEHGITVADLTPAYWHQLLKVAEEDSEALRCLRLMIVGGDTVLPGDCRTSFRKMPGVRLINAYGLTETTITSTLCILTEDVLPGHAARGPTPVGRPLEETRIHVLDQDLRPVPPGRRGEIYIGGCGVARGYWRQPLLTAEHFLPDAYGPVPGERMYRTGDLGRWRLDGNLEVLGRADHQTKVRGFRVDLAEVESAVAAHPAVGQAAVVLRDRGDGDRALAAYYTPALPPSGEVTAQIRSFVSEIVPDYMVPATLTAVDELPVTHRGKIDRQALSRRERTPVGEGDAGNPSVQTGMAQLWAQILNVERVRPADDFFELGGNSLLAMEMLARARIMFGIGVTEIRNLTRSLLHNSTLSAFTEVARSARAGAANGVSVPHVDFGAEAELRVPVRLSASRVPRTERPAEILLTGATGFCGTHLLSTLLASTRARIHCLVRAPDADHALERIRSAHQRYLLRDLSPGRVVPIVGDLTKPFLGMPQDRFEHLAATVDLVYHCGGEVNFIYPYHELRDANVSGTREVIRLAGAHRGIPVHYISSMAVLAGLGAAGVRHATEETPLSHAEYLGVGYVETKWVAEKLLHQAAAQGLPVAIYRPNDVTGDQTTGVMNPDTEICALIRFIADSSFFPDVDLPLDFIPADCFARTVTHVSTKMPATGDVYHLTNPGLAMIGDLADRLDARGYPVRKLPYDEWVRNLVGYAAGHPTHPVTPFVPLFVDRASHADVSVAEMYFQKNFPSFTRRNTERALRDTDIEIPPVDDRLLDRYIDSMLGSGYLDPPPSG